MRPLAVLIVTVFALGLVGACGGDDEGNSEKVGRGDAPAPGAGIAFVRASAGNIDRNARKTQRRLLSCLRKNGYDIDMSPAARRDLRRDVPKRSYTISWYDFESNTKDANAFQPVLDGQVPTFC